MSDGADSGNDIDIFKGMQSVCAITKAATITTTSKYTIMTSQPSLQQTKIIIKKILCNKKYHRKENCLHTIGVISFHEDMLFY